MRVSHNVNVGLKPFYLFHKNKTVGSVFENFHAHQGMEFLFIYHGQGTLKLSGRTYQIRSGSILIFQPFEVHRLVLERDDHIGYVRSIIIFDANVLNHYLIPFPALRRFFQHLWKGKLESPVFDVSEQLCEFTFLYENLHRSLKSQPKEEHNEIFVLFMIAFLQNLRPYSTRTPNGEGTVEQRKQHYAELIMQWIEEHYTEPFVLEKLAADLHLTTYHTSRLFRNATGNTITDYLIARRLKEACLLLQTTKLSVEEIGIRVGIPNPSHFCTIFGKKIGLTPAGFRKMILHT
ncbi:AraC family transcriptional regulator [Paenibacillus sp. GD4]|uniref:AraC family transcriptional regulator n=1 Tax=Paenibacillus sp. GD4 TaxID=3068890 RepID=UPI002796CA14|nr:AraC family transcriptional regulator [Paenibacillus sp. GD4]MDQ1913493.1 AraC family transcriptional regulator [Paenibacillus sp. GD4]